MDDVKPVYPPFNFIEAGGIMIYWGPVQLKIMHDDTQVNWNTICCCHIISTYKAMFVSWCECLYDVIANAGIALDEHGWG